MAKTSELIPVDNASGIIYNSYSRFNNHPIYVDPITRKKFIGSWQPPTIQEKETDILFEITSSYAYRPDIISYNFYGTPLLAWVLAYVNNISNPFDRDDGFYPGRVIRITDITTLSVLAF